MSTLFLFRWGYDNGLKTMVTTLLQISFAGKCNLRKIKGREMGRERGD